MVWQDTIKQKRQLLSESIPKEWKIEGIKDDMSSKGFVNTSLYLDTILPESETKLVKLSVIELEALIESGELTSLELTTAICHRAALSHQILNNCIEIFFDEAISKAKELDEYYKSKGKTIGPLHGIPISLKDQVDLPGKDSSIGYVALVNKPASIQSVLASALESSGAIFYCKTAVPMAMMYCETDSNLHGYTLNGVNNNLSSGGSSGGEGSLIGSNGSVLGFGTDIGGSIRIPSSHQGLYALKPSTGRISYMNVTNSYQGQELVPSVIGPMAHSLEDIEMITKLIVDNQLWKLDPKVLPVPWRDQSDLKSKQLTIGIWNSDDQINPHPPVARGLKLVEEKLIKKGHTVINLNIPMVDELRSTINKVFGADVCTEVYGNCELSGEPIVSYVEEMITNNDIESVLDVNQWWKLSEEVYSVKQKFLKWWEDLGLDAIVAPVWPSTSTLPHGLTTLNYTMPFNITDCACTVLPVTSVDKSIDVIDESYKPLGKADEECLKTYDAELFDKMPVCVQVICKKLEEEKSLSIASIIDEE